MSVAILIDLSGLTDLERLRARIMAKCARQASGCWLWQAGRFSNGYGAINVGGRTLRAHRVSYATFKGVIPPGSLVCHSCDTPACVNPEHLSLGTPASNMAEKVARGRESHVSGNVKLTPADVAAIRSGLAAGETLRSLAARHGVSAASVSNIRDGVTWRDS